MVPINSIRQDKPFSGCFTKPLAWPKQTVSEPSKWRRSFPISFERLKLEFNELEAEIGVYQEKADRAEQWLHRVYTEIEDRFLRQDNDRRGVPQRAQGARSAR